MRRLLLILGVLGLLAACDGEKGVGDECVGGTASNDCVEGAFCTLARSESVPPPEDPNNERYVCRTICDTNGDCADGLECRRATGSMTRTCQPDDDSVPAADAGM